MSNPYIGEIRLFGSNFPPNGWANCDGALMAISQNDALFNLIGTTYGGDGQSTFALPNLLGRVPVHQGNSYVMGQLGGEEGVVLTTGQMPSHAHHVQVSTAAATSTTPHANLLATSAQPIYGMGGLVSMHLASIGPTGSGQAHSNVQPFLCVTFIISLFGIFPSQN